MGYIKAFVVFWYDFIVGDDWVIAAGVVVGLVATHELVIRGVAAWWLVPLVVAVSLAASLLRAARKAKR